MATVWQNTPADLCVIMSCNSSQGVGLDTEDAQAEGAPVSRRGRAIRRPARLAAGGLGPLHHEI